MKKAKDISLSAHVLRALDKSIATEQGIPDNIYDILRSLDTNPKDRRCAARVIAASVLPGIIEKALGINEGIKTDQPSLPAADVALRYLKFIIELDGAFSEDLQEHDPVELLSKLTGLGRDEIISLYHRSSRSKFMEVTRSDDTEEEM